MRDFRDAKTMAQSLRKALATHGVTQNHSQCLELIAQAFGLENWNTLSVKIGEARLPEPRPTPAVTGGTPQRAVGDLLGGESGGNELYDQAVAVVTRDRKASTSYIQRRLQIDYNSAAALMERMEREGVVGPGESGELISR